MDIGLHFLRCRILEAAGPTQVRTDRFGHCRFAPFLLALVPLIRKDSYGLSQITCWIAEPSCEDQRVTFIYSLAISTVPQIVLTQFGFSLMSIAIISLLRKMYLKIFEQHYWIVVKEILPVMLFPTIYSLVFFGRMIGLIGGFHFGLVDVLTVALNITCSVFLPISLLLRPGIRRSLCREVDKEKEELITKFQPDEPAPEV